jgi:ribokinase
LLVVLGSINLDLTTVADEIPIGGVTVVGKSFNQYPGGKGANQAVCAAKLKTDVHLLGKVGNDANGDFMIKKISENGVDVSRIERSKETTGIAAISVDSSGQNSIIVVPGANTDIDNSYIDRNIDLIQNCDIFLSQFETPINVTEYAFKAVKSLNKTTILNPAPVNVLSENMIGLTDVLIPNEYELSRITEMPCRSIEEIYKAVRELVNRGAKTVIATLGKEGVLFADKDNEKLYPAFRVNAIDTTAAGDSFIGGFAASYGRDKNMEKAIIYGQLAASYSVQHKGAQSSMPDLEQLSSYQKTMI